MTLTRRRLLQWSAALAAALAACGRKEDVPRRPPPPPPRPRPRCCRGRRHRQAAGDRLVYLGPLGDAGWTYAHERGRQALIGLRRPYPHHLRGKRARKRCRGRARLPRSRQPGQALIFGTSFGYMEPMLKIARQFPEVRFEHATGYKTASNLGVYAGRMHEPAFLAGVIAGQMTRSNVLGFVGAVPIPEVIRNINAFTLGARAVNPKAVVKVVWVNKWFDPGREREAAGALAAQHADVLIQNTDSPAVLQYAEERACAPSAGIPTCRASGPGRTWPRRSSTGASITSRPWATCWRAAGSPPPPAGHQAGDERPISLDDSCRPRSAPAWPAIARPSSRRAMPPSSAARCRTTPARPCSPRAPAPTTRPCWR